MRILIDCSLLKVGGGIQAGLSVLENAVQTSGVECHAVLSDRIAQQLDPSVRAGLASTEVLGNGSAFDFARLPGRLGRIERRIRPDVVFTVFGPTPWRAEAPHLQGFALPRVIYPGVWVRGTAIAERLRAALHTSIKRWLTKRAEYLVVETELVRQRLRSAAGIPGERVLVVPNSYSPRFEAALNGAARRTSSRFTILVPSSYYRHKNLEIVPEVAQALRDRGMTQFTFVLTVPSAHGGWRRIAATSAAMSVTPHVQTRGHVSHAEFAQLYRQSDAVLLPTLLECSTAVYPEAFLAEVPLITSDRAFARELCDDAALYVDPADPRSSAEALMKVMTDARMANALVCRGRQVLARNYVSPRRKWMLQLECLRQVAGDLSPTRSSCA